MGATGIPPFKGPQSGSINGYDRIYHIHCRRAAGTSLNYMLLEEFTADAERCYQNIARSEDHTLLASGKVFAGWSREAVDGGRYQFGFSHIPVYKLQIPDNTFTICCLRDPLARLLSYYRTLLTLRSRSGRDPGPDSPTRHLGSSFSDFLNLAPLSMLCNQLYMFSASYDVNEAVGRALRVSHIVFAGQFAEGVAKLNDRLNLRLELQYRRRSEEDPVLLSSREVELANELLEGEWAFFQQVQAERMVWGAKAG